ncbi:MAG TPA: GMC family oxidoreductase, partial [Blastocatellia bacterium]|nr:GMC family oxidoreductase [Blastocatellia bacterium]
MGETIIENARNAWEHGVGDTPYDVVIVGAGISGAILAKVLGSEGKRVLILEAGTAQALTNYLDRLEDFYLSNTKDPESPYPNDPDAPEPSVLDIQNIQGTTPDTNGYFVQMGPLPFGSTYTRTMGGTTLHWLGTCLRMLPEDFKIRTLYGQGLDWPISYDDLLNYYNLAEREIGVSADVREQEYLGVHFTKDYVYPMFKIPQSYLDKTLARGVRGMTVELEGGTYPVDVTSTPQGRNSMPNPAYAGGKGYTPAGATYNPDLGQRCDGNTSCVPICPIQAKYSALKTLIKTEAKQVDILTQAVASRILFDKASGRVTGIEYKAYADPASPVHKIGIAKGTVYALAAHAVENAKLLQASGITSRSGLIGKNLMDHPVLLTWGLAPEKVWAYRGPLSTSGIESLRGGKFRSRRAAFRVEIGNDG